MKCGDSIFSFAETYNANSGDWVGDYVRMQISRIT